MGVGVGVKEWVEPGKITIFTDKMSLVDFFRQDIQKNTAMNTPSVTL